MIRTLLADDHPIVRDGLRAVLQSSGDFDVVGTESDGERALASIRALRPDVAILDIEMPGMSGIEVARHLNDAEAHTSVVLLSLHGEDAYVQAALAAGVAGYVVKEDAARDLLDAVRAAARGEVYLSPRIAGALVSALRKGEPPRERQLTPRERDVVRLLCEGLTSKEIAARLDLSPRTVHGHRAAIMDKLGIRSVAGLVKYAIRNHLTAVSR